MEANKEAHGDVEVSDDGDGSAGPGRDRMFPEDGATQIDRRKLGEPGRQSPDTDASASRKAPGTTDASPRSPRHRRRWSRRLPHLRRIPRPLSPGEPGRTRRDLAPGNSTRRHGDDQAAAGPDGSDASIERRAAAEGLDAMGPSVVDTYLTAALESGTDAEKRGAAAYLIGRVTCETMRR